MNDETKETQDSWEGFHPWVSTLAKQNEVDSVNEVIWYAADDLRFV